MNNLKFSSFSDLELFFKTEKFKKIFIICGENSYINSGAEKLLYKLLKNKFTHFFFKKFPYPDIEELNKIIKDLKDFSPDLIIAIGGGSVLDYAKIANSLALNNDLKNKIKKSSYTFNKNFSKLLAIPTTAGSGAEVTSNAVIYIDKIKFSVEGKKVKPDYFFLIPEIVIRASHKIKSSAGFDAIAQSIESLIAKNSNHKSVNYAKQSLEISLKNFLDYLNKPSFENTSAMCLAANLSGRAINISKTTAPHAVSYPFTSLFGISHGHAVSLTLNKFLKFNYNHINKNNCSFDLKKRFKIIFDLSKTNNIEEFDKYIINLKKKARLEDDYISLGINIKKDYAKIISKVNLSRLSNNPIKISQQDLKDIIQ